MMDIRALASLIRVENILKNTLWFGVGLAPAIGYGIDSISPATLTIALLSYLFCWFFVYSLNDYSDHEEDKKHKRKAKRPLPSGKISIKEAKGIMLFFLFASIILSLTIGTLFAFTILASILVGLAYNSKIIGGRTNKYLAIALLWAMEALRILSGATATGEVIVPITILLGLPSFYIFAYHFYWEDAKRFVGIKGSKLLFLFLSLIFVFLWLSEEIYDQYTVAILMCWMVSLAILGKYYVSADFEKQLKYSYYFIYISLLFVMILLLF